MNERLNGLVNMLHAAGINGVDPDALVAEQKRLRGNTAPTTSEDQILEIVRKLQLAQADSPEIIAALRSPELRALASLAAAKQAPKKPAPPTLDDIMDDDDDNYPKIGPGYSDDISVVSDLTTPTVMTKQQVMEEEYYRDVNGGPGALPPMHIGLGAQSRQQGAAGGFTQKTKNLVSQVKPNATRRAIAKTGGAAAQRRLNYQQAMAKLQSDYPVQQDKSYMEDFSPKKPKAPFVPTSPTPAKLPSELPSLSEQGKKIKQTRNKTAVKDKKGRKTALAVQEEGDFELDYDPMAPKFDQVPEFDHVPGSGASASSAGKKKKERSSSQDFDWGVADTTAWPAFDDAAGKSTDVFVDDDGFFSSDVFGQSAGFSPTKATKPKREESKREDGTSKARKPKGSKDGDSKDKKEKKKPKSRRASLTM